MEFIYVLKCQQEKYFIWKTYNVQIEYNEHLDGTFCQITKEYKPYDIDCIFELTDKITLNSVIAKYCNKYGSKNIYFLDIDTKKIKILRKEDDNKCICGQEHWLAMCPLNTKDKFWTMVLNKVVNKLTVKFHQSGICCRCGRYGHNDVECYAKTHIEGHDLDSDECDFTN
jgi:hypothetical protein